METPEKYLIEELITDHFYITKSQLKKFIAAGMPHHLLPDGSRAFFESEINAWVKSLPPGETKGAARP